MPSEMMHLYDSGILKQVCQSFTDSMSTNVQVGIDNLMEDLFWSQQTTLSSSTNFLCTNFHGGATHLAMPSSHHWPGMAFSFLLMLLTPPEGNYAPIVSKKMMLIMLMATIGMRSLGWILNMSTNQQY
jgi:hypothetical protein